jgi:hypothetical protein
MDGVPYYIQPISPTQSKDEVHSDIMAFDMSGAQYTTGNETKEVKQPRPNNDLIGATAGVLWNDHHVTMTRFYAQHMEERNRVLEHFAQALTLCPLNHQ